MHQITFLSRQSLLCFKQSSGGVELSCGLNMRLLDPKYMQPRFCKQEQTLPKKHWQYGAGICKLHATMHRNTESHVIKEYEATRCKVCGYDEGLWSLWGLTKEERYLGWMTWAHVVIWDERWRERWETWHRIVCLRTGAETLGIHAWWLYYFGT